MIILIVLTAVSFILSFVMVGVSSIQSDQLAMYAWIFLSVLSCIMSTFFMIEYYYTTTR